MPPKRKAAAAAAGKGGKAKKAKTEPAAKPALEKKTTLQKALSAAKKAAATGSGAAKIKVDARVPQAATYQVYQDYDAMLNQTNIGKNNNKYYVIQVLQRGGQFFSWNRWGRVGENGMSSMKPFGTSADAAVKDFKKKFFDKTKNNWEDRANFTPVKGKYTLLEMSYEDDEEDASEPVSVTLKSGEQVEVSSLDKNTQNLMQFIFSKDMFRDAMADLKIDVKKMPLGKLSKAQIAKGFEVLEELERDMNGSRKKLGELSSRFYTVIPHNFGRMVPPVIKTQEELRSKLDMLLVLSDIVVAQALEKENEEKLKKEKDAGKKLPNPLDVNYQSLRCKLEPVDAKSDEFKKLQTYQSKTGYGTMLQLWRVDREGEEDRHVKAGDVKLDNRKLLWHGTSVAVVAAILRSGLRIMPHSGGRVGKGIYFASEHGKSACYTGRSNGVGLMFLNEVALGKIHKTLVGDGSITKPPNGFHSILAEGRTEPDPKLDTKMKVGNREVVVPQGPPKPVGPAKSHFSQSEYLIYKESQCRIRYLAKIKF